MYIMDGIVYGGEPEEAIKVSRVKVLPDKILLLTFSTGETRLFDATILTGEIYKPLEDIDIFNEVSIDYGVVTWDDGAIDCSPEFMYENSYSYQTVFEKKEWSCIV